MEQSTFLSIQGSYVNAQMRKVYQSLLSLGVSWFISNLY